MVDVDNMSDAELRAKLLEFGFPVMPITGTTRKVMTKKLKLLLESKNKVGKDNRRSLGRYSSEDDSDSEAKTAVRKDVKYKRQTMAAVPPASASMQPPLTSPLSINSGASKVTARKSSRLDQVTGAAGDGATATTLPGEVKREVKTSTTTTTRTTKILQNANQQDEYDTGSESDDIMETYSSKRESPLKTSFTDSYSRNVISGSASSPSSTGAGLGSSGISGTSPRGVLPSSFISTSLAADAVSDHLSQMRSRISQYRSGGHDQPLYGSGSTATPPRPSVIDDPLQDNETTPYLSNFTKRLSRLSETDSPRASAFSPSSTSDYKSDIIKENDINNGSGGGALTGARNYLSSYRSVRGRPATSYDYNKALNQQSLFKNNFVPLMVLVVACLFFVIIGVVYLGIRSDTALDVSAVIPPCIKADVNSRRYVNCVVEGEGVGAINLLRVLKPELTKKAVTNVCLDSKVKPYMTEQDVIVFIKNNYATQNETKIIIDLTNLEVLSFLNPSWGIAVLQFDKDGEEYKENKLSSSMEEVNEQKRSKYTALIVTKPHIPWKCYIYNKASAFFNLLLTFVGGVIVLSVLNYSYKFYNQTVQRQKDEEMQMVENIIDVLQSNCSSGGATENSGGDQDGYMVINHVRDMILPVQERRSKSKTWARAVQYINENESRIRTEIQVVRGEPSEVWRWLAGPNLNTSKNKSWQGQAFETQFGSVNSLPCSPTPCLKIRGMVEEGDRTSAQQTVIKRAVLSKCASNDRCRLLHCAVDVNSKCVYLKCADTQDAAVAYRNLHGWWYAGNLVTVKYLRLERYMQRFPDSPVSGPPFLK